MVEKNNKEFKPYSYDDCLLQYGPKEEVFEDYSEKISGTEGNNDKDKMMNTNNKTVNSNTTKKNQTYNLSEKPNLTVKEALAAMFDTRRWQEAGRKFIQTVSDDPATRENAKELFRALESKLKERRAREESICPIREQIFAECFEEIIRQVTIECPERGLLLLRVRDQLKMTIASYQILYESAILFGIRKQLQAENEKSELMKKKDELIKKKIELTNKKMFLTKKLEGLKEHIAERNEIENERRENEKKYMEDELKAMEQLLKIIEGQSH